MQDVKLVELPGPKKGEYLKDEISKRLRNSDNRNIKD
jgi:hypothetical protein